MIEKTPRIIGIGAYDAAIRHKNVIITKKRFVKMYEIEYITEDGGISYINDKSYKIKKGNIICAKPGHIRRTFLPFKCFFMHIIVDDEQTNNLLKGIPEVITPSNPELFEKLFRSLIANYTSSINSELLIYSNIYEIISMLIKEGHMAITSKSSPNINNNAIKNALAYIDENLCNNITLESISSAVHVSKIYFHNMFLTAVGQTTHQYILQKRLAKAKHMILTTNRSYSDIALECGFSSQSYLNYVFKKETGYSPRKYKSAMNEK